MRKSILLTLLLLSGCAGGYFDDGYQFGDVTKSASASLLALQQAIDQYCSANANSPLRQAALALIRQQYPLVPENGICLEATR